MPAHAIIINRNPLAWVEALWGKSTTLFRTKPNATADKASVEPEAITVPIGPIVNTNAMVRMMFPTRLITT
jgi:hypothetical protein